MPFNDPFAAAGNPDFYRNLMQFGFATMSAANKPGASTLGALGEGGMGAMEAAQKNALARAQNEYYGQNTLNKKLENQAALDDMNLDRRALGQSQIGGDITPLMDTNTPSGSRSPGVGATQTQLGTETRPASTDQGTLSEDALLRIARGNVSPRNVGDAESALAYTKKGSAKEKYLQDYIDANRFTGEKEKAKLPYDLKRSYASANAGAEGQIARLVKSGIPKNDAISIVDGSSKVVTDPVSGSPFLVNLATGTSRSLSEPIADVPPEATSTGIPDKRTSLYELAGDATGPVSAAKSWYSALTALDPTGILPIPKEAIQAREQMGIESNQLVRQLQTSPRFVEGERKAIEEEVTIKPEIMQSPQLLRARMEGINLSLTDKLNQAEREVRDTSLPVETRRAAKRDASSIRNFLKKLDVPKSSSTPRPNKPSNSAGKSLSEIWGD